MEKPRRMKPMIIGIVLFLGMALSDAVPGA